MSRSLVYRSPAIYEGIMRVLYGPHYSARYSTLSDLIPPNESVLDVCCGPATLYARHLKARGTHYTGLDLNETFIARLRTLGGDGILGNVSAMEALPVRDCVLMQASLYHFMPDVRPVIEKLLRSARRRVIIAEPVRNLADSPWRLLRWIAKVQTDPGSGVAPARFNATTLAELFSIYRDRVIEHGALPGNREHYYVLRGQANPMERSDVTPTLSATPSPDRSINA